MRPLRPPSLVGVLALLVSLVFTAPLLACGDKFLVGGYSLAYLQVLSSAPPARILVYWNPDPEAPAEDRSWNPKFQEILEQVGHSIEVVTEGTALRLALQRGDVDLVLLRLDDARDLQDQLETGARDTVVIPYLYFPTGNEYRAAKKEFGHALKAPMTVRHLVGTIDASLRMLSDR